MVVLFITFILKNILERVIQPEMITNHETERSEHIVDQPQSIFVQKVKQTIARPRSVAKLFWHVWAMSR